MANLDGMDVKFIVIKNEDLLDFDDITIREVNWLLNTIKYNRTMKGKTPNPTYIVINTDETYADEVIDILKRHGHWGR